MKGALKKLEGTSTCQRCVNGVVYREADTGLNDGMESGEFCVPRR